MASAYRYTWTRADGSTGKAWRARWVGSDGRARSKRGFDRKGDAESYAADREAEARHGVTLDGERPTGKTTVETWAKTWLEAQEVRPGSLASYGYAVKRINAAFGGRSLASLRPSELRSWRKGLRSQYAVTTAEQTAAIFAMLLRAAAHDGLIPKSPMPSASGKGQGRIVDPAELLTMEQVWTWDRNLPEYARGMALVAATTGLRQGELRGLQVGDVDFLKRIVRVRQQLVGACVYGPPKTAAGVRTVPLSEVAAAALSEHIRDYPSPEGEPIFLTRSGRRWSRSGFHDCWSTAATAAELPDWAHWHALRDVAASALIRSGVDLRSVMSILGHTSSEETLRTYARLWPDAQDNARKALDAAWSDSSTRQGRATGSNAAGQRGSRT
jgi:integrase